ncbi:type IV inositol polyphosphate 5-phosphatase 3 [Heracleum sosnowskyi]|uniref:Type IV inositol polyphosphate 5-phosphatase 3 n=1 Tax=Heracleum sosnowskyi TaxID=360622 RepID=A0AAD8ND35_9APIA|nr:type IV inositol polyphosphate 5-phosphatase 3 [Heracleum sosnowskyi]
MKLIHRSKNHHELGMVVRKLLHIRDKKKSDYSSDHNEDDFDSTECDTEELCVWPRESKFEDNKGESVVIDPNGNLKDALPRSRRRNSETSRAQYITTKELRVCAGTWNVGGELPPDDLDIKEWLDIREPADIYVLGFQEIIPLNAGNIFGAEYSRPIPKWEQIIGETLNKIQPVKTKCKCYSHPPSPSRLKQSKDFPHIEDEVVLETDSDEQDEIYSSNDESKSNEDRDELITGKEVLPSEGASSPTSRAYLSKLLDKQLPRHLKSPKTLARLNCLPTEDSEGNAEAPVLKRSYGIRKTLSKSEMVGLSWAEPPLDLLAQCILDRPDSLRSSKSFKASKSFKTFDSSKSSTNDDARVQSDAASISKADMESLVNRKRKSHYVRIASKQMVGIFVTLWVRRSLRRHIQNVNVSTVGVGVMGYIGNKGSISVSMSIYQTLFCFVCTHLSAGEKEAEAIKRNADVRAIHRRTHFNSFSSIALPKSIHDHERIIWLGDLNYRINLPYDETRQLISKRDWSELAEYDQLAREFRRGRAFDGWSEGTLKFPPTYKYELNSEKYYGEDPKIGRRTPAWCDRIISFGKGMKLLSYRRTEHRISDHRPVAATYMVEVEVFCPKRLQKALSYTDAEIENDRSVARQDSRPNNCTLQGCIGQETLI